MSIQTTQASSINYYVGFLSVLFAAFLWGTAGTAASFSRELNPIIIGLVSIGVGGLIHTLLSLNAIKKDYKNLLQYKSKILIGVVVSIACPVAFYSSVATVGVSIGTVVSIGFAPLFTVMLEWLFDKRPLSLSWFISFVLGFMGVVLLSFSGNLHHDNQVIHADRMMGVIYGLISGLSYATYSWTIKSLINKDINSRAAMGTIFGICSLIVIPILFFTATNLFRFHENIFVGIYIAFVPMFLGYLFFSFGLKRIPASQAMTLALFELPVATLLAVILVGESLTFSNYLGLLSIFLCIIVLTKK